MARTSPSRTLLCYMSLPHYPFFQSFQRIYFHRHMLADLQGWKAPYSLSFSFTSLLHSQQWRSHHEEDSRFVKVSVWWDIENCNIPSSKNVVSVVQRITSTLRANGIRGPVTITAFGDVMQLSRTNQEALISAGVCLSHVPNSGKNSADRSLLIDLVSWVSQNPPPAHLFLISGDKDFAGILHRLRMSNYNILLATADGASTTLSSAATIMWHWNEITHGDSLTGKHFNHPPDGPYESWYGHYKGPLEDSFVDMEVNEPTDLNVEPKPRPIPKALTNRIKQILSSYTDGVSLSELRLELGRQNVTIDKDFFGYKKFSKFLLALPDILRIHQDPSGEGQPLVYRVPGKASVVESPLKPSPLMESQGQQIDHSHIAESRALISDGKSKASQPVKKPSKAMEGKNCDGPQCCPAQSPRCCHEEISLSASELKSKPAEPALQLNRPTESLRDCKLESQAKIFEQNAESPETSRNGKKQPSSNTECQTSAKGILGKRWVYWLWPGSHISKDDDTQRYTAVYSTDGKTSELGTSNELTCAVCSDVRNFPQKDSRIEKSANNGRPGLKFFSWLMGQFDIWKTDEKGSEKDSFSITQVVKNDNADKYAKDHCGMNTIIPQARNHELFDKAAFWDDVKSFLLTTRGRSTITRSRNRNQLSDELQKQGPSILKVLSPSHMSHMIDVLIFEKKWVEEASSQFFPFRLTDPVLGKSSPKAVGLSFLFSKKASTYPHGSTENQPQNLTELKNWLNRSRDLININEAKEFSRHFESEFRKTLDPSFYGFSTVGDLLEACLHSVNGIIKNSQKNSISLQKDTVIADCKNLLIYIAGKYPEGFKVSSFKQLFYERYHYILDNQAIGFPKLSSLLQILPGIKVCSELILPSERFPVTDAAANVPGGELDDRNGRECKYTVADLCKGSTVDASVDLDSAWDELGPVSKTVSTDIADSDREYLFSEEDISDPEDYTNSEGTRGKKIKHESSLLEVLDSWYSARDGKETDSKENGGKNQPELADGSVNCSRGSTVKSLNLSFAGAGKHPGGISQEKMLKSTKNYSFVSEIDSDGNEKDKLIDSILLSLKKSTGSRQQNRYWRC